MPKLEFHVNQGVTPAAYLAGLNTCFHDWGDERQFAWAFQRDAEAGPTDLIVVRLGDEVVGGSAVVYRVVADSAGKTARIGIVSGSWTLPTARRRGCLSGMLQTAASLASDRGAALLASFMTSDNPSRRRVEATGAQMTPTAYCVAEPLPGVTQAPLPPGSPPADLATVRHDRARAFHFRYPSLASWTAQHVQRRFPTRFVALPSGAVALLEASPDTDRVLALQRSPDRLADLLILRADASLRGQKTFFFSSTPDEIAAAARAGFTVIPGFFTTQVANADAFAAWTGARTPSGQAAPAWPWRIEDGDRM